MISASSTFYNNITSTVRPKIHFEVGLYRISFDYDTGEYVKTLKKTFGADEIETLSFKNLFDPASRELPDLSVEWEITNNKNEKTTDGAFIGCIAQTKCYIRNGFFQTWQGLKQKKWKDLKQTTWSDILKNGTYESITLPATILKSVSVENGATKYSAAGLLGFVSGYDVSFLYKVLNVAYVDTEKYMLDVITTQAFEEVSGLLDSPLSASYKLLGEYIDGLSGEYVVAFNGERFVIDDTYGNALLSLCALKSQFVVYATGEYPTFRFGKMNSFENAEVDGETLKIPLENMYDFPQKYSTNDVGVYEYKKYSYSVDYSKEDSISANSVVKMDDETDSIHWCYDKSTYKSETGVVKLSPALSYSNVYGTARETSAHVKNPNNKDVKLTVYPVNESSRNISVDRDVNGDTYQEDNKLNVYLENSTFVTERIENISKYFNANATAYTVEFNGNPMIEPGDVIEISTGEIELKNGEEQERTEKCAVVSIELKYAGYLKETLICHSISEE